MYTQKKIFQKDLQPHACLNSMQSAVPNVVLALKKVRGDRVVYFGFMDPISLEMPMHALKIFVQFGCLEQ